MKTKEHQSKKDRLKLIKKLATRKKRKVGNDSSINRLLRDVEKYAETTPDKAI